MRGTVLPPLKKGWQATLDLHSQQAGDKTVLASVRHVDPLAVQRLFYPGEETYHLYLLRPPGDIVGGDELTIIAHLDPGCHTPVVMFDASEFYRSSGVQVLLCQQLILAPQATLEWFLQDAIFFPGVDTRLSTIFHLCASSTLLVWDLLYLGHPAVGETFSHDTSGNRLEARMDEISLLVECLHLQEGKLSSVAEYPWVGTLLCYPATDALLDGIHDALAPLGLYAGAGLIDCLLTVRFLSDDNLIYQQMICDVWQFPRPHLTGESPVPPRIWLIQEDVIELTPREEDKLLLFTAAPVAEHYLARSLKLNYPESVALISAFIIEGARDGKSMASLMEKGRHVLTREQVMEGVLEVIPDTQVKTTLPDGSKPVIVHNPIV